MCEMLVGNVVGMIIGLSVKSIKAVMEGKLG